MSFLPYNKSFCLQVVDFTDNQTANGQEEVHKTQKN